jgi:DNA-directed RNA polymerase alpha subunit
MEEKKVKIRRRYLKSVPEELKTKVDEILRKRTRLAVQHLPDNARYHVGGEQANLIYLMGGAYYEKKSPDDIEEKIPVEYLKLTDELYNKLKVNGYDEVSRYELMLDVDLGEQKEGFFVYTEEDEMLNNAVELLNYNDELNDLGLVEYDEVDLNQDIVKQIVDARGIDDILDIDISRLPVSLDLIIALSKDGCEQIRDVIDLSENDIFKITNNEGFVKELKDILTKLNLQLKTEEHTL